MVKVLYAILLSLTFFLLLNGDLIEQANETSIDNQNLTKSIEIQNIDIEIKVENNVSTITDNQNNIIVANDRHADNDLVSSTDALNITNNSSNILNEEPGHQINVDNRTPIANDTSESIAIDNNNNINSFNKEDSIEASSTNTDDIPTFVEYQQMIEKETKQKREKSDSIPNIPTMAVKEGTKGTMESASSHIATEHSESSTLSASKVPETKDDVDVSHNSRKADEGKVELTTSTLSKSLMKNNVAAKECGAKILEISNQISHAGFVLNNNKDEYLNVPCSIAEKWFIIETCEPVQIRSIQIANFEMFSSRPKTFKVTTADRYPVKHWYNLGLFRAHDDKGIQTFEVSDTRMVKYLKFEMVDHYGNEHYCPLTFVRVMGNVVIDDMDEEPDEDQADIPEKNEVPKEVPPTTDSNGILTKAKDMIVKIVNGIGGTNKQNSLDTRQTDSESSEEYGTKEEGHSASESPCYLFEFLSRNFQNHFQSILIHFQRVVLLKQYLLKPDMKTFHLNILNQPFPFQIRVEYFSLLTWISKTDYSFFQLYLSYLNVSTYCTHDYLVQNSIKNLTDTFRCKSYHYQSLEPYLPLLPNVTLNIPKHEESLGDSSTISTSPDFVLKDNEVLNNSSTLSPPLPIEVDNTASLTPVPVVNISTIEDVQITTKNKTEEDSSDLSKDNKSSQTSNEQLTQETLKLATLPKYKSDEVFDNKMFSSPGSNAWNYAFMRIKNIAKELEVNVSISMKYLEELSQNYKQQTDKLKKAQIVMAANVTKLENMINQHRQETRTYIKELKLQLQAIIIKMKFGMSTEIGKRSTKSSNLSAMPKDPEQDCIDILSEDLTIITSSWFESTAFCVTLNVSLLLLCNSILLAIFYNKMKTSILNDVAKIKVSSCNCKRPEAAGEFIEEINSVSLSMLSPERQTMTENYPVVLPPRGVHISNFPDCEYFSDDDNLPRRYSGFGPHFYPVQPNVNFVTPTKDKKKKKRK